MERFLMLLKLLFTLCLKCSAQRGDLQKLVAFGDPVPIQDAPYYAGLYKCGAVVISKTWILTAAHCVEDPVPIYFQRVWVGGESFGTSQSVPYDKVIMHEEYSDTILPVNDIALIRLATPLRFTDKIQPIQLPVGAAEYKKFMVLGRGEDETGNASKYLKKLDLIQRPTKECIRKLVPKLPLIFRQLIPRSFWKFVEMTTICAKKAPDGPSICFGDSGGPLVSGNTLVGLVSYIEKKETCPEVRLGFYVNVTSYLPWIKKHTGL